MLANRGAPGLALKHVTTSREAIPVLLLVILLNPLPNPARTPTLVSSNGGVRARAGLRAGGGLGLRLGSGLPLQSPPMQTIESATFIHKHLPSGVELAVDLLPERQTAALSFRMLTGVADDPAELTGIGGIVER